MVKKINVAILGAGHIAAKMAEALKGIEDQVTMYAVASRTLSKAELFASEWGFAKAYGSYEELAMDEKVDLVYIATPHSEHFKNAMLCLEHRRNCLVEKAFCANIVQTKKLIAKAREKDCLLAEAMWTRYQPSKDIISGILKRGTIGECHYLEADFSVPINVERMTNPVLAGGSLLDLGIYSLTVPAMYFGTDILKVKGSVKKFETGVDSTMIIDLTYTDGRMAHLKCSAEDELSNYAKIVGERGYIVFGPINVPTYVAIYDNDGSLVRKIDTTPDVNGYEYEVLECRHAILNGELETVSMPLSQTVRMMNWMDSLRNHFDIVYPFEKREDIVHPDRDVWGHDDVYED